jgi:hypothetical protein
MEAASSERLSPLTRVHQPKSNPETPPSRRHGRRFLPAFGASAAAVYAGQFVPFFVGPLTECWHCVSVYLMLFVSVPGIVVGQFLMLFVAGALPGAEQLTTGTDWSRIAVGVVVTAALLALITGITSRLRGRWRGAWLVFLAVASALNALVFSAVLRA